MAKTTNTPSRPTHRVYAVKKIGDDKSRWTDIGAAWPHRDGKGYSLKLDFISLNGAELVIRAPMDREGGAS